MTISTWTKPPNDATGPTTTQKETLIQNRPQATHDFADATLGVSWVLSRLDEILLIDGQSHKQDNP